MFRILALVLVLFSGPVTAQEIAEPPMLEFAFEVTAEVGDPLVIDGLPTGQMRRIIEIVGGTLSGPGLKGKILPGGADWQTIRDSDGFTVIDARYTIEMDDGHHIYVSNLGMRHASPEVMARLNAGEVVDQSDIYFRAVPTFETDDPELGWLMKHIFVCTGERYPNGVVIRFWKLL